MHKMCEGNKDTMDDYYSRFPVVLRTALKEKQVVFPSVLLKSYSPELVYRGIRFVKDKKECVEKEDFLSQAERALPGVDYGDIGSYSCSCFRTVEGLVKAYQLPRKNKAIARGMIRDENGPIIKEMESPHIHWFLFSGIDPSNDFEVCKDEKMD